MQHLTTLLAADSLDVVVAALTTLCSFIKRSVSRSLRWQADAALIGRLFNLAQGLGRSEEVSALVAVSILSRTPKRDLPADAGARAPRLRHARAALG